MAGISIQISTGDDSGVPPSVTASGQVMHVITDDERNAFQLEDADLKAAVAAFFGKSPDDAYLHDPTPWNNLYATYGWTPVTSLLEVKSAEVVEITSEPVVVAQNTFTNHSAQTATFSAGVTDSVTDTVESNWSQTFGMEASQSITYGVSFLGSGGGGETTLSFNASFGQGGSHSTSVTVGSEQAVSVELEPGESVVAKLNASRGSLKVRVTYQVRLLGATAVNYSSKYKDHHFWALGIDGVLQAGGHPSQLEITEELSIGYFANAQIVIENSTAKAALAAAV